MSSGPRSVQRTTGVTALVEVHFGSIVRRLGGIRMVDGLDPTAVGVLHDVGNLVIEGQEHYDSAFELLGPYLAHVHLKNTVWVPGDRMSAASRRGTMSGHRSRMVKPISRATSRRWCARTTRAGSRSRTSRTAVPLEQRTAGNLAFLKDALRRAGG